MCLSTDVYCGNKVRQSYVKSQPTSRPCGPTQHHYSDKRARLFNLWFLPMWSVNKVDSTVGNPSCLKCINLVIFSLTLKSLWVLHWCCSGLCTYSCDFLEELEQGVARLVPPSLSSGCADTLVITLPFTEPRRSSQGGANKQTSLVILFIDAGTLAEKLKISPQSDGRKRNPQRRRVDPYKKTHWIPQSTICIH